MLAWGAGQIEPLWPWMTLTHPYYSENRVEWSGVLSQQMLYSPSDSLLLPIRHRFCTDRFSDCTSKGTGPREWNRS